MPNNRPEVKLAQRLIAKRKLTPPVDIFSLATIYAEVREFSIPFNIDGVCLDLKALGKRPRIFINKDIQSEQRRRFTLAHELGHVLIPWHVGSIVDTGSAEGADWTYRFMEGEANRFASELLIPMSWLQPLLDAPDPAKLTHRIHEQANVSWQAATLRLIGTLPRSYGFAQVNRQNIVVDRGGWRPITGPRNEIGTPLCEPREWVGGRWEIEVGGTTYIWWKSIEELPLTDIDPNESWRARLEAALSKCGLAEADRRSYWASINGIISAGNTRGQGATSPQAIKFRCMRSFTAKAATNRVFSFLLENQDFLAAIDLRSIELSARRTRTL